ncbi:hypothetical protein ACFFOO_08635 [Mucilaginibacter ginsenosidivorans]
MGGYHYTACRLVEKKEAEGEKYRYRYFQRPVRGQ